MAGLREAITVFRQKQLEVYRLDPGRISRDTRGANRAADDHIGRWLLELLQNSDDANAKTVVLKVADRAIYVADNGDGITGSAVEAISGTDFSGKSEGTIGRKGIGFKAVYTVTDNPQIFSLDGEGIEFSLEKSKDFFERYGLPIDNGIPYQWLPFFVSRAGAGLNDPLLAKLKAYNTVIKLPVGNRPNLPGFPRYGLIPFRNIRELRIITEEGGEYSLKVRRYNDGKWKTHDSTMPEPLNWAVKKENAVPTREVLCKLSSDEDRRRVSKEGITFLLAAPLGEDASAEPLDEYIPIYVFYPAEKDLAPVRMLLHAEFNVESDRKALLPVTAGEFNDWVADRLVAFLLDFVQEQYDPSSPAAFIRLLVPMPERESHLVANTIWGKIVETAKRKLQLPGTDGTLNLSCESARLLGVSVNEDAARRILDPTSLNANLLHHAADDDTEASRALKALGCGSLNDADLLKAIDENASEMQSAEDWIWSCWEWLATWVADKPHGDEHKKRLDEVGKLRILPVNGKSCSLSELTDDTISWRSESEQTNFPDWLPIRFVDDWFRDRLLDESNDDNLVHKFLEGRGVREPKADTALKALGKAIEAYWKKPDDNPGRFIELMLANDWHEKLDPPKGVRRCPILTSIEGDATESWVEASHSYFGEDWGNEVITQLYAGVQGIAWAVRSGHNANKYEPILMWLGVKKHPRIIEYRCESVRQDERVRLERDLPHHTARREFPVPHGLDRLDIGDIRERQKVALLMMLAEYWEGYYCNKKSASVEYRHYGWHWHCWDSLWWKEVKQRLYPPICNNNSPLECLEKCWLPDKDTVRAVGKLLPVIDLSRFGDQKKNVGNWLKREVHVRTQILQITKEEWRTLLCERIPDVLAEESAIRDEKTRGNARTWYVTCLQSLDAQEEEDALGDVPLLARKGETWELVGPDELRYLHDNNEMEEAFRSDVWHVVLRDGISELAKRYFGLEALSSAVTEEPELPAAYNKDIELEAILQKTLPYIFAWSGNRKSKDHQKLKDDLRELKVHCVDRLNVRFELDGIQRTVDREFGVKGHILLIAVRNGDRRIYLAKALAKFLKVKTDAPLYQILLGCENDSERKQNLLAQNVSGELIGQFLKEFDDQDTDPVVDEIEGIGGEEKGRPGPDVPPKGTDDPPPGSGGNIDVPPKVPPKGKPVPAPAPPADPPQAPPLKNPHTAEIEIVTEPLPARGGGGSPGPGGQSGGSAGQLSPERRREIEQCGKDCAMRILREHGWAVEDMDEEKQNHPGYDLKATRDGKEIHIELKTHERTSGYAYLSVRQYKEYIESKASTSSIKWQLWTVENLVGLDKIRIRCYDEIPNDENVMRSTKFRLDLGKCRPITDWIS